MRSFKLSMFILILFLGACGGKYRELNPNMSENVADFSFTTQDKNKLSPDDLEGDWWIANYIFTNCTTVCLPMTSNMSRLQDLLNEEGIDVQLISFTVDPDNDSPDVLKKYAEQYDVDFSNWSFLTGSNNQRVINQIISITCTRTRL